MTSFILYSISIFLLLISFFKDKNKTKKALIKALKSFENIMPQFLSIIIVISVILSILDTDTISHLIGKNSGFIGVFLSSIVGSITMMPTFVAFSTANTLLENGAGYSQVAALVSTLTMVGVITFTLEAKYIGKKTAFFRNLIAFFFSFIVAFFIDQLVKVNSF
ncbi:permease [Asaccharospora irregularis]|uniref:permease n=1 Tax=Asaccharospora irregularis TaxID=29359 RepID=UPI0031D11D82